MSAKSIAQLCAAKLQHFFELSKSKCNYFSQILTNSIFCDSEFLGRSLVLLWFILGLLFGVSREGTTERNLNKSAFLGSLQNS